MLVSLLTGWCLLGSTGNMVPPLRPDTVTQNVPGCEAACGASELGSFGAISEVLQGFTFTLDTEPVAGPTKIPQDIDPAPGSADAAKDKAWILGPEPPAALLALSGVAFIGLAKWRRRSARRQRVLRKRLEYTVRQMA